MKSTHQSFSVSFVCGPPGSGKSYLLTRDIVDRLISFPGRIITNLPLNVDVVAEYVAGKLGCEVEAVVERIVLLDREALVDWQDGRNGPWELVERGLADGNDFILDECHLFCRKGKTQRNERWEKWLGEVRHEGWRRCLFVTQDESKVGQPITAHAEMRFELTNSERLRDPILRIPLSYWYELIASLTGEYRSSIAVFEYRRTKGRLREQHVERVPLDPAWFPFYRSYEAAGGGTGKGAGGSRIVREFEKRPRLLPGRVDGRRVMPVWAWMVGVHWWRFTLAVSLLVGAGWVTLGGGMSVLLNTWMERLKGVAAANSGQQGMESSGSPSAAGAPVGEAPEIVHPAERETGRPRPREVAAALIGLDDSGAAGVIRREFDGLAADLRQQRAQLVEMRALEAKRARAARLVGINAKRVWFEGGAAYSVGETIREGSLSGKKIVSIQPRSRLCLLDDGSTVTLGVALVGLPNGDDASKADGSGRPADVPGPVPTLAPEPGSGRTDGPDRAADNTIGGRDEFRSVLKRSSGPSGSVDHRPGGSGESADLDGSQQRKGD